MDAADLLQRAGGDLPGVDGRGRPGAGGTPAHRPPHRPALRGPQRPRVAAVHGGVALLRRARLARLSRSGAAPLARIVTSAWLVHLYTASGALFGFLALTRIFYDRYRDAFFWIALTIAIDATDGLLAR